MKFRYKFLISAILVMVLMQVCINNFEPIHISFMQYKFRIGIYTICALILLKWLIQVLIRNAIKSIKQLFCYCKNHEEVKQLAMAILYEDVNTSHISEELQPIRAALLLRNNIECHTKTGIKEIDIYIIKQELRTYLQGHHYNTAVNVVNKSIKEYPSGTNIIKNEILELAKQAKNERIKFEFDAKKSKYKLSKQFIEKFYVELGFVECAMSESNKLQILEKLYKNFPKNIRVMKYLLEFKTGSETIDLIKKMFITKPDRNLAYIFLKLYNNNDNLEIAQKILNSVPDNNIEKIWFLLIVATKMQYYTKIKELITKVNSEPLQLADFYVKNYEILSQDSEIIKKINGNKI